MQQYVPAARTLNFNLKWVLRSFGVTHYVILNAILYAFYEWNEVKRQLTAIRFVKRIQNDVQDDVMHDAKWSKVSLEFKWRFMQTAASARWNGRGSELCSCTKCVLKCTDHTVVVCMYQTRRSDSGAIWGGEWWWAAEGDTVPSGSVSPWTSRGRTSVSPRRRRSPFVLWRRRLGRWRKRRKKWERMPCFWYVR